MSKTIHMLEIIAILLAKQHAHSWSVMQTRIGIPKPSNDNGVDVGSGARPHEANQRGPEDHET